MDDADSESGNACERCGKRTLVPMVRRVAKLFKPGYVDFFRCESCGHISQQDTAHEPPKK